MNSGKGVLMKRIAVRRGRVLALLLLAAAVTVAVLVVPGLAGARSNPTCLYSGKVAHSSSNWQPVLRGTVVEARVDGVATPFVTTTFMTGPDAMYKLVVPWDDPNTPAKDGGKNGDVVRFTVKYKGTGRIGPDSRWSPSTIVHNIYLTDPGPIRGDGNGDGVVNYLDITKVKRIINRWDPPTPGADANRDGVIDQKDIDKIVNIILGIDW